MNLEMLIELCADTNTRIIIIDDEDKEAENNDE